MVEYKVVYQQEVFCLNDMFGFIEMFWPFLVLIGVFYFFMYRPQKKQERERREFLDALKKGDYVITAGGIYGTVKSIHDEVVSLEIAPKTVIKIEKASVIREAERVSGDKRADKPEKKPEEDAAAEEDEEKA